MSTLFVGCLICLLDSVSDFWLLNIDTDGKKKTQLEDALENGRSFKKEELLAPNKWLTPENYQTYVRRVVEIIQKFKVKNMTLDGDTDQAFEELKEELQQINESNVNLDGHRKPHTAYIANRVKLGKKRGESWEKFKQLANDSIGKETVLPFSRVISVFSKSTINSVAGFSISHLWVSKSTTIVIRPFFSELF